MDADAFLSTRDPEGRLQRMMRSGQTTSITGRVGSISARNDLFVEPPAPTPEAVPEAAPEAAPEVAPAAPAAPTPAVALTAVADTAFAFAPSPPPPAASSVPISVWVVVLVVVLAIVGSLIAVQFGSKCGTTPMRSQQQARPVVLESASVVAARRRGIAPSAAQWEQLLSATTQAGKDVFHA